MPVTITTTALAARIRRRLAKDRETIRRSRGERARVSLGDWYLVDLDRNAVIGKHVDLVDLGRRLGALQPGERVA